MLGKSRRRDQRAIDFDGYMLVDRQANVGVVGYTPYPFSADLDEIEAFLTGE